jgi:oxygen-independent coproporphyrinogen-3 oxidase
MTGLYIHIPYCKRACHYCDFHFSTLLKNVEDMLQAILKEAVDKKEHFSNRIISTLYLGGGSPSVLSIEQLNFLFKGLAAVYDLSSLDEFTIEVNPGEVNLDKLKAYKDLGINRLSVGVQTFQPKFLSWMNRSHTVEDTYMLLNYIEKSGINQYSFDLIYGINGSNDELLINDLEKLVSYNPHHISAYCLTIEPNTVFGRYKNQGKLAENTPEFNAHQYDIVTEYLTNNKYEQYEVSNFAKNEQYAKHNSGYWLGKHYIGLGPSAHSYNGEYRMSNLSNNANYIKMVNENKKYWQIEVLSPNEKVNEAFLIGLRCKWGVDLSILELLDSKNKILIQKEIKKLLAESKIKIENNRLYLNQNYKIIADNVAEQLFVID